MAKTPNRRPTPEPESTESRAVLDRIAIPMNADGTPAFDRMRGSTRDNLKKIVSNPETARALGLVPDADAVQLVPIDLARAALIAWSQLSMLAVSAMTKAPAPLLREHMTYNETQLDQMSPLAQKVLSKHAGPKIAKWSDEIALGAMLLTDLQMRMAIIRAAMRETKTPAPAPAPVAPIDLVERPASPAPAATDERAETAS